MDDQSEVRDAVLRCGKSGFWGLACMSCFDMALDGEIMQRRLDGWMESYHDLYRVVSRMVDRTRQNGWGYIIHEDISRNEIHPASASASSSSSSSVSYFSYHFQNKTQQSFQKLPQQIT